MIDTGGSTRHDVDVEYASSDTAVADIDRHGFLTLLEPGTVELSARAADTVDTVTIEVESNPVTSLALRSSAETVLNRRRGSRSRRLPGTHGGWPYAAYQCNSVSGGRQRRRSLPRVRRRWLRPEGRFVAERSGTFAVVATTGSHWGSRTIRVRRRDVRQDVEVVGRGPVLDRHTSDLWIWEGTDGHDYAISGTWGSDGDTYIWDVTDPSDIQKIREVHVDARTVNDVKVSEAGDIAVISREGASDRKNGIVILGVGNPREGVPVLSEFTDQLTGGVHNVFISENHVFALSAGRRYDVINIEDPANPRRVGRFELDTPGHGVHDVWVSDGVAFSSNWADGVVAVDVGGGGKGGTPERPVELGRYRYPSGWNHAAFPYKSGSTGKFYLFAGDESFPHGNLNRVRGATPTIAAGWIHIIDWSDWEHPREGGQIPSTRGWVTQPVGGGRRPVRRVLQRRSPSSRCFGRTDGRPLQAGA